MPKYLLLLEREVQHWINATLKTERAYDLLSVRMNDDDRRRCYKHVVAQRRVALYMACVALAAHQKYEKRHPRGM